MSHLPEVRIEPLQDDDAFLVLACDGIWDVLSNEDAIALGMQHWGDAKAGKRRTGLRERVGSLNLTL